MKKVFLLFMVFHLIPCMTTASLAQPLMEIPPKERCPVCGMFVAKYATWIAQIRTSDGQTLMFDGVKDLMVYYFTPEAYGKAVTIEEIHVKDYYTMKYIDGKKAIYVTGSDVLGPMGHEFIPFSSFAAAENFMKDHKGEMILTFSEITPQKLAAMRSGGKIQTMSHGN